MFDGAKLKNSHKIDACRHFRLLTAGIQITKININGNKKSLPVPKVWKLFLCAAASFLNKIISFSPLVVNNTSHLVVRMLNSDSQVLLVISVCITATFSYCCIRFVFPSVRFPSIFIPLLSNYPNSLL